MVVVNRALAIVDLTGKTPSGWQPLIATAHQNGIQVSAKLYADGTNWGWDDCEEVTIEGGGKSVSILRIYPYARLSIKVNGSEIDLGDRETSADKSQNSIREALAVVREVAELLRAFPNKQGL